MRAKKITGGMVTLPAESGREDLVLELARKWGADAIRDSDGTRLSAEMMSLGYQIYSTICLVRADQKWAKEHEEHLAEKYLISSPVTAVSGQAEIDLMKGYFKEKYRIDKKHDPQKWWDVMDRTTGEVLDVSCWEFVPETGKVVINNVSEFHVYTVNFLVYLTWDSTSMYNHMLNKWESEHIVSVDPYHAETYSHLMDFFDTWLENHPDTDIVRLTSLAYHFTLDSDNKGKAKYSDWLGYTDCVNLKALEDFAKEKGYQLTSEDFIDQGYYNATYRVPSQRYLDWMDFIHMFVVKFGKELVERIHKAGKKAAIFWGDHWIGVEPYSPHFQNMKIDINIGACEDGVALRRIADDVDIIINDGDAGTSWSGGRHWNNEKVVSIIRGWVHNGGGFIGVRDPSAYESNGRFFQLSDILGVQKEIGYSINFKSVDVEVLEKHFICEDQAGPISVGHGKSFVYVCEEQTEVLAADPDGHISMAANRFGKGRSVYLKELPFNMENSRLLYRALLWTGQKEDCLKYCFSSNLNTECAAFPETGSLVIVNNVNTIQDTIVYYEKNLQRQVALKPYESKWIAIK